MTNGVTVLSGLLILGAVLFSVFFLSAWVVPMAAASMEGWIRRNRSHRPEGKIAFDQYEIVIDEVWGMLVTIWPMIVWQPDKWLLTLIIAFFLFRVFDGTKVWPASFFDGSRGWYAVMLDDFFAGLYASLLMIPIAIFL